MKELLDIIQVPFLDETSAVEHFSRLDLELDRVRSGSAPDPAWYAGVVRLRPRHQLVFQHSVRRRAGRLYCESRIERDLRRSPTSSHTPLPESEPPPDTQRSTPDSKRRG